MLSLLELFIKAEIQKCANDFHYFCRYLKIGDKRGRLTPFGMNDA